MRCVKTRQSEIKEEGDMNNRAARMRPTVQAPISFPVSAGSARNETVSKDQIDGH